MCLLRARLAALGGAKLSAAEAAGPLSGQPPPRMLERAASQAVDSTGLWPSRYGRHIVVSYAEQERSVEEM